MEWDELRDLAIEYFENNMDEFSLAIEELDSWNGYLGDYRRNSMYCLDDYFCDSSVEDIIRAALNGTDYIGRNFDPEREFFYWTDYGHLVSTDDCDYSDWLDKWFIQSLYERYIKCKTGRWKMYEVPEYIMSLFDEYYEETGNTGGGN